MRAIQSLVALALMLGLASSASGATAPAETADVLVQNFSFQPPAVTIVAGGSVTWTVGSDPEQHTVTPREPETFEGSGQLFTGAMFTVTFQRPGTIEYFCSFHPTMVGTVAVSAPTGTPTPAPVPAPSPPASPAAGELPPAGKTPSGVPSLVFAAIVGLAAVAVGIWFARRRA
jgi:plastocyanin